MLAPRPGAGSGWGTGGEAVLLLAGRNTLCFLWARATMPPQGLAILTPRLLSLHPKVLKPKRVEAGDAEGDRRLGF